MRRVKSGRGEVKPHQAPGVGTPPALDQGRGLATLNFTVGPSPHLPSRSCGRGILKVSKSWISPHQPPRWKPVGLYNHSSCSQPLPSMKVARWEAGCWGVTERCASDREQGELLPQQDPPSLVPELSLRGCAGVGICGLKSCQEGA